MALTFFDLILRALEGEEQGLTLTEICTKARISGVHSTMDRMLEIMLSRKLVQADISLEKGEVVYLVR